MTVSVCMRDSEQHSMVGLEARWAGSLRRGVFTNRKSPATSRAGGHRVEATLAGDLLLLDPDPGAAFSGLAVEAHRVVSTCTWSDIPATQASVSVLGQESLGRGGVVGVQESGDHLRRVWNHRQGLSLGASRTTAQKAR